MQHKGGFKIFLPLVTAELWRFSVKFTKVLLVALTFTISIYVAPAQTRNHCDNNLVC